MLTKLVQNDETIKALKEQCVDIYNFHREEYCIDVIANGDNLEYYYYPLNKCDDTTDAPEGFYLRKCGLISVYQTKYPDDIGINSESSFGKFDREGYFEGRRNTGYCNDWKDILDYYPEILISNRKFVVVLNEILHKQKYGFNIDDDFEGEFLPNGTKLGENQDYIIEYAIYEFVEPSIYEKFFDCNGNFNEDYEPFNDPNSEFHNAIFNTNGTLNIEAYEWLTNFVEDVGIEPMSDAVALLVLNKYSDKTDKNYDLTYYWR